MTGIHCRAELAVSMARRALPNSWPEYDEEVAVEVHQMIARGDVFAFGDHPKLTALEDWARSYFKVGFALAVSSGTAALHSAYVGLGIRPGDEVLVPTYTFHATATPLLALGAVPVLYDCETDSTRPSLAHLESRLSVRTAAIVVSHMFGLMGDMKALMRLAAAHGLPVVEDASQAHGAWNAEGKAGSIGTVGCFSLGGQKMISGGMGGLLLTNDEDIFNGALAVGHAHERAEARMSPDAQTLFRTDIGGGLNLRMHPIAAALALSHAQTLDARIAIRARALSRLSVGLEAVRAIDAPTQAAGTSRGAWYGYKVLFDDEEIPGLGTQEAVKLMQGAGLKVDVPSTRPLHKTSLAQLYRSLNPEEAFPNASALAARTIGFPDKSFHNPPESLIDEYVSCSMALFGSKDERAAVAL